MLYVLPVLCAVSAAILLETERRGKYVTATIFKGLASLCFVTIGFLCSPGTSVAKLIVFGLVTGCIADILLNLRNVFQEKGQLIFLVGILVFLAGHIMYIAAIAPMSPGLMPCIIAGIVLTAVLLVWIFSKVTAKPAFKIFGVVYVGAIVLLNCIAVRNLITGPSAFTGVFVVGAVLFLVSDLVLIMNTFGDEFRESLRVTNICLYYAGQILIAFSLKLLG